MPSAIERLYHLNVGIIGVAGKCKTRPGRMQCRGASATVASHPAAELQKDRPRKRHNDHPTKAPRRAVAKRLRRIALCKNHHWAMDRDIQPPRTGPPLACSKTHRPPPNQ
jgi:hypothetical protein